jgi:hypothetical protein
VKNAEQTRLAELRAKTDLQLTVLLDRRLRYAVSSLLSSDGQRSAAESVYAEARAILPLIYQLSHTRRKRMEALLVQLRVLLGSNRTPEIAKVYAAC